MRRGAGFDPSLDSAIRLLSGDDAVRSRPAWIITPAGYGALMVGGELGGNGRYAHILLAHSAEAAAGSGRRPNSGLSGNPDRTGDCIVSASTLDEPAIVGRPKARA